MTTLTNLSLLPYVTAGREEGKGSRTRNVKMPWKVKMLLLIHPGAISQ